MEQLSGLDNFMLYDEQGNVYNHVAALGIYDPSTAPGGKTRFKDILHHFKSRMVEFPIFRRKLVSVPYGIDRPYWADGGAITSARCRLALSSVVSVTRWVVGRATPAARYTAFSGSTAPCATMGPMVASTPCSSRCALPKA